MKQTNEDRMVTIATHLNVVEAAILQSRLEIEEIDSYVIDGIISDVAWHLSNAVGGAKVQVRSSDAQRATRIAGTKPDVDDVHDDEWAPTSARRCLLDKAIKMGLMGFLFAPLQVYSVWLLLCAYGSKGNDSLTGTTAIILFINSPTILLVGFILGAGLHEFGLGVYYELSDGFVLEGIP